MRERFKINRVCSSKDYELSRKVSKAVFFIRTEKKPYVMCFGKKIYIPKDKVSSFGDMVKWE